MLPCRLNKLSFIPMLCGGKEEWPGNEESVSYA